MSSPNNREMDEFARYCANRFMSLDLPTRDSELAHMKSNEPCLYSMVVAHIREIRAAATA